MQTLEFDNLQQYVNEHKQLLPRQTLEDYHGFFTRL